MVICLERGADLHMGQLMPLPLTVCCFSKIQIGFTFLVPAYSGSPGQRAVKRVCGGGQRFEFPNSAFTLLVESQEGHLACRLCLLRFILGTYSWPCSRPMSRLVNIG